MNLPKVLLIDDEQEFVSALKERFALRGLTVEIALNGEEGLSRIKTQSFDVVLLDMRMPGMNCQDIMRHIKEISPRTQIIIMTGYGSVQEGALDEYADAYTFLEKPIKISELMELIQQAASELPD